MPISSTPSAASSEFTDRVDAHRGILFKVAASYGRNAEDRADLIQDISLQLWRAWPGYDRSRPFATWMYRIALNVAITQQRRARPLAAHDRLDDEHAERVGLEDVDAEDRERLALVQRAMHALGALDRALLLLHLDGCGHREIGEVLGIRDGNVATRLGRIKQHLRRQTGADTRNDGETR
ncbi:MAG: sigma-70 family RNA polymerase sigma factor [Dokdonella sp.]|nr:sigma-70 family RNA polymerase sigma factor [Dokdonella sp.]